MLLELFHNLIRKSSQIFSGIWMFKREFRKTLANSIFDFLIDKKKKKENTNLWVLEQHTMPHLISTAWLFLLHIVSNARMNCRQIFPCVFLCLLGHVPLTTSTFSSDLFQVFNALKTNGEPLRSFSLEIMHNMLQKTGEEMTLTTLIQKWFGIGDYLFFSLMSSHFTTLLQLSVCNAVFCWLQRQQHEEGKIGFLKWHEHLANIHTLGRELYPCCSNCCMSALGHHTSHLSSPGDGSLCCLSSWHSCIFSVLGKVWYPQR